MTRIASRSSAAVFATVAALSLTRAAGAEESQPVPADAAARAASVQKLSDEGAALYQARDFNHAIDKFQRAYAVDPDPNLLYNIAKCYDALGDNKTAIEKYEQFINSPGADSAARVKAQESVRVLKGGAAPAGARPGGAPAASREDQKSGLRVAAWVTLGVGVVSAGAGTVVYLMGASDHSKITNATNYDKPGQVVGLTEAQANDLRDSGTTKKTIGAVFMGVGGAALVTSAVLFILQRGGTADANVAVGATPLPGGAAGALIGRF